MSHTAKLFLNGRSQAVRLPASYRFEGAEVFIRKDPATGDVILSSKPTSWDGFVTAAQAAAQAAVAPDDFLSPVERHTVDAERDPFADPH
ncbi:MAG: AbrB/MazE/SpoVT family DNA-binding domain-containing protein [Burkholderiaceae bacterium]|nr:AbrB/MazE/SpoVT family DNA-binding domain-containing protein [Burkholderiaceae bacterium]